jgi:hypothetical protein
MATALSTAYPTLLDFARAQDPDGRIAPVAEVLNQYNEIIDDIVWQEGNLPTGHRVTLRKSIPTPTWRLFNQGVTPVKTTRGQITETCGMMEAYAEVDKDEAELNGNTAEWRMSEDLGIIEGMNQEFAKTLFYGDTNVNPEKFVGFAPRYWTTTAASSPAAGNVISAGGSSSVNSSIWLVGWSNATVHGIFPKGSTAGLINRDLGEVPIYDAVGSHYQGYRTQYQWKCGVVVKDWRYVVRIANVDMTNMATVGDSTDNSGNILKYMSLAIDKLFNLNGVTPVFYMNRTLLGYLRVKLMNAKNMFLTLEDYKGPSGITRPTIKFQGIPIRRCDQILNTEATVS